MGGLQLLPPADDKCSFCAVDHEPEQPHDATSFYYQFYFNAKFKRSVTWSDAIAHCSDELKALWKEELIKAGVWTEHPEPKPLTLKESEDEIESKYETCIRCNATNESVVDREGCLLCDNCKCSGCAYATLDEGNAGAHPECKGCELNEESEVKDDS